MANANVEKIKALGLRHGEKAVVGLSAALCVLFVANALTAKSLPLTANELAAAADTASANLNRTQPREKILERLQKDEVKDVELLKTVMANKPGAKSADPYRLAIAFATPEPGAGLIRETPELIAPVGLLAHFSRGQTTVYQTNDQGDFVSEDENKEPEKPAVLGARKKTRRAPGGFGGGGGGGRPKAKARPKTGALAREAEAKAIDRENQAKQQGLAGEVVAEAKAEKDETKLVKKEVPAGVRAATILGVFDHQRQKDLYAKALKVDPASANPHYLHMDVERQERLGNGTWPKDWETVDRPKNQQILNTVVENEKEPTPEDVRLKGLVDKLPLFKSGIWSKVHVASLVPAEARALREKPKALPKGMAGGRGNGPLGGMSGGSAPPGGYGNSMPGGGNYGAGQMGGGGPPGGYGEMGGNPMSGIGAPGGGGGGGGGGASGDYPTSTKEKVMVRALDFTVEPDISYRYRLRIVVANPNYNWDLVLAGVDIKATELAGPWSEPTEPVTIPADVATYVMAKPMAPQNTPGGDALPFGVVRWKDDDGLTVAKTFEKYPGQVVGEVASAYIPDPAGKKEISRAIDFTSHQVLLDGITDGRSLAPILNVSKLFDAPALALLVRADGSLVLRDEASDSHSNEYGELDDIYKQSRESVKAVKPTAAGPMGGMGAMGGMRGAGGMP